MARQPGNHTAISDATLTDGFEPDDIDPGHFARSLIQWHATHGRKDLPWQKNPTPYRVWLSEIMLQQTRVSTVIPYYRRFLRRFPGVARLAAADIDDVLHLWAGLGYYARGRNLHRAAGIIMRDFKGRLPDTLEELVSLPGIGRSTAGAILAFSRDQRHPILDANVKRVLTRVFAISGNPGSAAVNRSLWALADRLTPEQQVAVYTQAIMDLGATLCSRRRPGCPRCPLAAGCRAHQQGNPEHYPGRGERKKRPVREVAMLVIEDDLGRILLEKRGPSGIWGGLWSLPESDPGRSRHPCPLQGAEMRALGGAGLPPLRHGFTHFELLIRPRRYRLVKTGNGTMDANTQIWYNPADPQSIGLPAVISRLLASIRP